MPGAGNPAAWNRYGYAFCSPLRFIDSDGHLSEDQIAEWTGLDKDNVTDEIWQMLLNLRFGDVLSGYDDEGNLFSFGMAMLDASGHLAFGDMTVLDLLNESISGFILTREIGEESFVAYQTGGYEYISDFGNSSPMFSLDKGFDETVTQGSQFMGLLWDTLFGFGVGVGIDLALPQSPPLVTEGISAMVGFSTGLVDLIVKKPGTVPGDRTLTYYYQDRDGGVWTQTIIIRDEKIIYSNSEPYEN